MMEKIMENGTEDRQEILERNEKHNYKQFYDVKM